MLELVHEAGTHVMFENQEIVAHNALVNPALRSKVTASSVQNSMQQLISGASFVPPEQDADKVQHLNLISEYLNIYVTVRAYYHGWVFSKLSPWKESMDEHILLVSQVGVIFIIISPHCYSPCLHHSAVGNTNEAQAEAVRLHGQGCREVSAGQSRGDDRDNYNDDGENDLEVMDLGFFILPNLLLVGGLGCALLAFLWELSDRSSRKY